MRHSKRQLRAILPVLALFAASTATPVVAQSDRCSETAKESLASIGAWAQLQCSHADSLGFAALTFSRCSEPVVEGLRRVGAWAEVQCVVSDSNSPLLSKD
jgi:hypothetical protein